MPNKMLKRQQMAIAQAQKLRGIQDFYKLKLGYKQQPFQVEAPAGMNTDTTPMYLQTSKNQGGS